MTTIENTFEELKVDAVKRFKQNIATLPVDTEDNLNKFLEAAFKEYSIPVTYIQSTDSKKAESLLQSWEEEYVELIVETLYFKTEFEQVGLFHPYILFTN